MGAVEGGGDFELIFDSKVVTTGAGLLLQDLNFPLFGLSRILFFCPVDASHYEL